jgi:hypothetical protein
MFFGAQKNSFGIISILQYNSNARELNASVDFVQIKRFPGSREAFEFEVKTFCTVFFLRCLHLQPAHSILLHLNVSTSPPLLSSGRQRAILAAPANNRLMTWLLPLFSRVRHCPNITLIARRAASSTK